MLLSKVGGHPSLSNWVVESTENLRLHFPPESRVADKAGFSDRMERAFKTLMSHFRSSPTERVDIFVWNTSADAEQAGLRPLGFARPALLLVHTLPEQTPGHELAHVVSVHAAKTKQRSRFIDEGTSVAFDLTDRDRLTTARAALRRTRESSISIVQLWQSGERVPEEVLYPVAGAFVERLLERGGRERFLRLLEIQTVEHARAVYGAELDQIITEFEADLTRN